MTDFCKCSYLNTKVVRTHGSNSRGYLVCKNCKKIVKRKKTR